MSTNSNLVPFHNEDFNSYKILFRQLANEIAALGFKYGVTITPYQDENLIHFSKLSTELQVKVLKSLQIYLNIYNSTVAEGTSALNSARVIWNALAQLGYRPTSDVFSFFQDGNIIEIYDDSFVQVFRSINFFNLCSYSLEDLYCHQITELYERDLPFEKSLMEIVTRLYRGEIKSTILTGLQPHVIQEKKSHQKFRVLGHIKYISPLYSSHSPSDIPKATLGIEYAKFFSSADNVIPRDVGSANATGTQP